MATHAADSSSSSDAAESAPRNATVVSVSDLNSKVRIIHVQRPAPEDVSYISATLKGLGVTLKHFAKNIVGKRKAYVETMQYPEEKHPYPERNRGLHRLMLRDDGNVRCVACMCCPTVCPADCITIVPAETDDQGVEKYPAIFEIDELRCVVCGLCVEACPCDAIRMDTGLHAMPTEERAAGVLNKEQLMSVLDKDALKKRGESSIAVQGGSGPDWESE